ncbi:S8 family peptidase [Citricoccus muralis]|uniref:Subtilase family protein n=1 Tax=Citricoccus muralis TaxID=169134 RepID=A0A3D9LIH6_9MICC|nr:S8 family serine peptidase [Citricoccus muralis]REE05257.1 subtilase family protein [Citricoccus muralis]
MSGRRSGQWGRAPRLGGRLSRPSRLTAVPLATVLTVPVLTAALVAGPVLLPPPAGSSAQSGESGALGEPGAAGWSALPVASADEWRDRQYWLDEYGFRDAWGTSQGEGVTVAVIDTGIDADHPDLSGQVVGGIDVSGAGNDSGTEPVGEMAEHGTLVASVLAGRGNNEAALRRAEEERRSAKATPTPSTLPSGETAPSPSPSATSSTPTSDEATGAWPDGIVGVAPRAELLSISVHLGASNPGGPSPEDQIAEAVTWAVDNGADVINMSLGSTRQDWPESWDRAFLHAEENDVVVVAAAGNRASGTLTAGAPATIPGVLTVAGLNPDGTASWDSSTEGISIGVAAPADPLVGAVPGGDRKEWAGTSGAAPLVAGLAALIRSEYPEMPAHQVIHRILATAEDAGVPGEDPVYGHGIIDAAAAVTAEVGAVDRNPMDTIADWIRVHRRAESSGAPTPTATPSGEPAEPTSTPDPLSTELPQATAPADPAPGLQPALVIGTGLVVAGLAATAVVLYLRQRRSPER